MKVLIFDDKMFFGKNGILVEINAQHGVVADALVFDVDPAKARTSEPDNYSTDDDLNDFREALGLEKLPEPEEVDEEEEEDDGK